MTTLLMTSASFFFSSAASSARRAHTRSRSQLSTSDCETRMAWSTLPISTKILAMASLVPRSASRTRFVSTRFSARRLPVSSSQLSSLHESKPAPDATDASSAQFQRDTETVLPRRQMCHIYNIFPRFQVNISEEGSLYWWTRVRFRIARISCC